MDEETREINERMVICLTAADLSGFFQIAIKELKARIIGDLVKNMRLSREDAEDCVFDVLRNVYIRCNDGNLPSLESPIDYLWHASRNQALALLKRRKSEAEDRNQAEYVAGNGVRGFRNKAKSLSERDAARGGDASRTAQTTIQVTRAVLLDSRAAAILAESLLDDTEPEPDRLVDVVALAMSRISPLLAEVIEYQLINGFDSKLADAARQLGVTHPSTFRKRKERAYAQLRVEILVAMDELGVDRQLYIHEATEQQVVEFPSIDEDDGT